MSSRPPLAGAEKVPSDHNSSQDPSLDLASASRDEKSENVDAVAAEAPIIEGGEYSEESTQTFQRNIKLLVLSTRAIRWVAFREL